MGIPEPVSVNVLADREVLFAHPHPGGIKN
jgi:hypothetical protein